MYIKDGKNKDYAGDQRHHGLPLFKNIYAFGWLGKEIPKNNKWKSNDLKLEVINKLKTMGEEVGKLDTYCGYQLCYFCNEEGESRSDSKSFCGSIKIKYNKKVYVAPFGVEHYIEAHGYCPPKVVIDAILNGHYYTQEELFDIGITNSDVIELKLRQENYQENYRKNLEKEDKAKKKAFLKARKKLVNDPKWQKKLQNVFLVDYNEC